MLSKYDIYIYIYMKTYIYIYIHIYTWIFHLRLFSDPGPKSCFFSTQIFFQALLSNSGPGHFWTSMAMSIIGWKHVKTTFGGYSIHGSWSTQIPALPAQTPLAPQLQHQDWSGNATNNYGIVMVYNSWVKALNANMLEGDATNHCYEHDPLKMFGINHLRIGRAHGTARWVGDIRSLPDVFFAGSSTQWWFVCYSTPPLTNLQHNTCTKRHVKSI